MRLLRAGLAHQGDDDVVQHRPRLVAAASAAMTEPSPAARPLLQAIDKQLGIGPEHQAEDISLDVTAGGVKRLGHDVKYLY